MKLGVSLWLWTSPITTEVISSFAPKLAKMGYQTIEVPLDEPDLIDGSEAKKIIEDNGLAVTTCAAMGPGRDVIHPDKEVRENGMAYLRKCIDKANELGSFTFAGPMYAEVGRCWRATDEQHSRETDLFVDQLKALSVPANDKGITLCIEPLNRFETSFMNLTSQALEVIDRVDSPSCKMLFDLFHAGIEEKSLGDAIRLAGDKIHHLQLAENDRGTPGTGQFAWGEVASALDDIGYDKNCVIETFSQDNETLIAAAAIWRPLAESPDALAIDGLAFLKRLFENHLNGKPI